MATIQCKICGGHIELPPGRTLGTCAFCGNQVTLPRVTDETHAAAFDRGNHFRRIGEFDKALAVYERIVQEDEGNAEAHWCCALCRFGIEYVKDPSTGEYLPTCHRVSFDRFLEDVDYLAALSHADDAARSQYQQDAEQIAQVQRGILAVSQSEKPFDVFLCYKETDADGQRTRDSQLAQDVYYQLTDQGLRVFFARITLEDKAGTQYEPYIFAALNTAKVMVVIGTRPEHLSATWVRNEWSRFLSIMKRDRSRLLIPCYRDMDPYDMPEQLSILQSYDMSRIGFIQDLVRGIRKVVGGAKPAAPQAAPIPQAAPAAPSTGPLLRRITLFLEDGDWKSADEYAEKVLDIDPECARAYLGKLMAALRVSRQEALRDQPHPFDSDPNYQKAVRFADDELAAELRGMIAHIRERNEQEAREAAYQKAVKALEEAKLEKDFILAKKLFSSLGNWRDAKEKIQQCEAARLDFMYRQAEQAMNLSACEPDYSEAKQLFKNLGDYRDAAQKVQECEDARKNCIYTDAASCMHDTAGITDLNTAIWMFQMIPGWRDADQKIIECQQMIQDIELRKAAINEEHQRQKEAALLAAQKYKRSIAIFAAATSLVVAALLLVFLVIVPNSRYNAAVQLMEEGQNAEALSAFSSLNGYRNSNEHIQEILKKIAVSSTMSAGWSHTVGIQADGTVVAVGDSDDGRLHVYPWRDIISVAAGTNHTVGLRKNGTVVTTGNDLFGQRKVTDWSNIISIAAGNNHTIGLQDNGTVIATGDNTAGQCNVSEWQSIIAVSAGQNHTVGLRADGTVVTTAGKNYALYGVSTWTDIVAIAAGHNHTVGLRADGTVVAVGDNVYGQCNVDTWTDIVAIAAGSFQTIGLRADGTVVAAGYNGDHRCDVANWRNITAIATGAWHTVGLREDGTVVATGSNSFGQCNVSTWQLKQIPRPTLPE